MINWVSQMTEADMATFRYRLSDPAKELRVIDWGNTGELVRAIENHTQKKMYGKVWSHCD